MCYLLVGVCVRVLQNVRVLKEHRNERNGRVVAATPNDCRWIEKNINGLYILRKERGSRVGVRDG